MEKSLNNMKDFLDQFEQRICLSLYDDQSFQKVFFPVSLKKGKLTGSSFANFIQSEFVFDKILSINYYGFYKKSSQINILHKKQSTLFPNTRVINSPVIYFTSIREDHIKKYAPELVQNFYLFKAYLIKLRWR